MTRRQLISLNLRFIFFLSTGLHRGSIHTTAHGSCFEGRGRKLARCQGKEFFVMWRSSLSQPIVILHRRTLCDSHKSHDQYEMHLEWYRVVVLDKSPLQFLGVIDSLNNKSKFWYWWNLIYEDFEMWRLFFAQHHPTEMNEGTRVVWVLSSFSCVLIQ